MHRLIAWWEHATNQLWIRIDMWLYARHRRRCTDCRTQAVTDVGRCHCGHAAVVQHKQMCVPCAHAAHPTCWCSVRPELADDINEEG